MAGLGPPRVPLSRLDPTVAPESSALAGAGAAAGAAVEKVLVKRGRLASGAAALEQAGMSTTLPNFVLAVGLSAALLGGQAWHDTRLHGYTGEHLAIGGAVLGLGAIVISMITFAIFYLICGIVASAAHIFVGANSVIPSLGASGAIAGVLGAYLVLFPKRKVKVMAARQIVDMATMTEDGRRRVGFRLFWG